MKPFRQIQTRKKFIRYSNQSQTIQNRTEHSDDFTFAAAALLQNIIDKNIGSLKVDQGFAKVKNDKSHDF